MFGSLVKNIFKTTTVLGKYATSQPSLLSATTRSFNNFSISNQTSLKLNNLQCLPYSNSRLSIMGSINGGLLKSQQDNLPQIVQTRNNWGYKGRMMLKDIKRRELLRKFAPLRIRLQTLRANTILPKPLKKEAEETLHKMIRHTAISFINNRCVLTSKAASCLHRWRISRHVWRDLADYNHMSGVTRATWGRPSKNAVHFTFKKAKRTWFNYDGHRDIFFLDKMGEKKSYRFKLN